MSDSLHSMEYVIFTGHYDKLCNTMVDINSLLPCFVQEKIIKVDDLEEINAKERTKDRVVKLLHFIDGPLQAGNVGCFYTLLKIMEEHGTASTADLSRSMRSKIDTSRDNSAVSGFKGQSSIVV